MSFAKNLKQMMNERNMTQAELAALIRKGKSSVSQYLSGKNLPKKEVQLRIAEVLKCSVEDLNKNDECDVEELRNVSVAQAAKILGKSQQFIRVSLQTGVAPFGFAVKNSSVWSYHISAKKLAEYIGAGL